MEFCENCDNNELLKMINHIPTDDIFKRSADTFKLLNDSTRLKILWLLCHSEQCVVGIAKVISMSTPAVSHHLRSLKQSKVIESSRVGKEVYYKIADNEEGKIINQFVKTICKCNY